MKFKVGDKVKVVKETYAFTRIHLGDILRVQEIFGDCVVLSDGIITLRHRFDGVVPYTNNRGKSPRGQDGRFLPKDILDKRIADKTSWGFKLPESLTINGVKYVKEAHV